MYRVGPGEALADKVREFIEDEAELGGCTLS